MEAFYPLKRPKTRNRWPSQENAPKIIFFAEMGCIYIGPIYIKRQSDSDNFLTFWYTLSRCCCCSHLTLANYVLFFYDVLEIAPSHPTLSFLKMGRVYIGYWSLPVQLDHSVKFFHLAHTHHQLECLYYIVDNIQL